MEGCSCCIAGHEGDRLCRKCFMLWYDSGVTEPPVLAREARWRKAEGFWPWGDKSPTFTQIEAMEAGPLPEVV